MLFDDIKRNKKGPRGHNEPLYEYINLSARSEMNSIRNLLDKWFSNYPKDAQSEFIARFRSSDDIQHQSAFFEFYLHALLTKLGFKIEVHPYVPDQTTHPEFLVLRDNSPCFYLEATLASGPSEERAADKRKNVVYETIDKMNSPNFFIGVKVQGSPETPPPGRKWRVILEKWVSKLDPDKIGEKLKSGGLEDLPSILLDRDGWNVTFQAIPKSPNARGKKGIRPIGLSSSGFHKCNEDEWIKNSIKEKATKYGDLNLPYIIAINVISIFGDNKFMVMGALFGKEGVTFFRRPNGGSDNKLTRAPNGAFWGPKGPQNTRVSGIIICNNLLWGNITKINPTLWHNPWSSFPLDQDLWALPQYVPNSNKSGIEVKEGKIVTEIFDLPENWPIQNGEIDFE